MKFDYRTVEIEFFESKMERKKKKHFVSINHVCWDDDSDESTNELLNSGYDSILVRNDYSLFEWKEIEWIRSAPASWIATKKHFVAQIFSLHRMRVVCKTDDKNGNWKWQKKIVSRLGANGSNF